MQHILYKKHTNVLTLKSGLIESSQQKMTQWANVITTAPVAPQTTWLKKITQVKQLITKSNNLRKVHASCLFSFFCGAMFNKLLPSQPFFPYFVLFKYISCISTPCICCIYVIMHPGFCNSTQAALWLELHRTVYILKESNFLGFFSMWESKTVILLKLSEIHVWKLFLRKQRNTTIVQIKISL